MREAKTRPSKPWIEAMKYLYFAAFVAGLACMVYSAWLYSIGDSAT
ncbi:MAG: hypothetical protein Q8R76_04380 [Candidatus Omnitrophota bacterium]|nr:hypothetical protein [Candidatus Omnitrophota bacterium]